MSIQTIKKSLIPLLIIVVAVAVFMYMKSTKPEQAPVEIQEKVWMVDSITVKHESLAPVQRLYGQVESNSAVSMSAPISGVVGDVWVKEGQAVKAGDPIVRMTLEDLEIPLQQAKADYAEAVAQLKLEKLAYRANQQRLDHEKGILAFKQADVVRVEQLLQKDLTSIQALEQSKEALAKQEYVVIGAELSVEEHQLKAQQNEARVAKAAAALAQAELNRQRGDVKAPHDGRIAKVMVSQGERINAGTNMVEFYALDSLELRTKLPVRDFSQIDQRLQEGKEIFAYLTVSEQVTTALKLDRMAGEASSSGVDLFFQIPQALQYLRPGDLLEVELQGAAYDQAIALPYSAIYGNDRIYLIEDERLKAMQVTVLGDLMVDGSLWALIKADISQGSQVSITHLPNAVTGLKVSGVAK
ncbi:MAG: biotin/lipoyl-binding protein [Pseudomonadota bacterium]|nr:biotin/lipoyl-binding protein [Pseudomonadota bacterium]